jgi:hypothetical protein
MNSIEYREYSGDFSDICQFWNRVWISEYTEKAWVTAAELDFFRWLVGPDSGALCEAAYENDCLVGSLFSVPHTLRAGSSVHSIGLNFGLTVDAKYRRAALPLINKLRERSAERNIAFSIATVMNEPTSPSYVFWRKYAEVLPDQLKFLFPVNYWGKILAPEVLVRASVQRWERTLNSVLGPLSRQLPFGRNSHVRPYRPADLARCADLIERSSAEYDWTLLWSRDNLRHRLESAQCETLVYELDGGAICGLLNCHCMTMQGRESARTAVIALWADDGLTMMERACFLGHFCQQMHERGIHAVVAPRCAAMPAPAFLANLFIPIPGPWQLVVFWNERPFALPTPKTWNLLVM